MAKDDTAKESFELTEDLAPGKFKRAPMCSFLFVVFLYNFCQWTGSDVSLAFFRTIIACDVPKPDFALYPGGEDVPCGCPVGSYILPDWKFDDACVDPDPTNATRVCTRHEPANEAWSLSPLCMDQAFVVRTAHAITGQVTAISTVGNMIAGSTIGVMLTDFWGRKPVLVISFLSLFCCCMGWVQACADGGAYGDSLTVTVWVYVAVMMAAFLNAFASASSAMAVDGTEPDSTERNTSLVLVTVLTAVGLGFSFGSGIVVLGLRLESYYDIWLYYGLFIAAAMAVSWFFLVETKPDDTNIEELTVRERCSVCCNELWIALEVIRSDTKMHTGTWAASLTAGFAWAGITNGANWAILKLGHNQETAALAGVVGPAMQVLGAAISAPLAGKIGSLRCVYLAHVLMTIGYTMVPLGYNASQSSARVLFWVGQGVANAGFGVIAAPLATLLSSRAPDEDQGKFFAGLQFLGSACVASFIFINSNVFLNATEREESLWEMTQSYSVCALGIALCSLIWFAFWGCSQPGTYSNPTPQPGGPGEENMDPTSSRTKSMSGLFMSKSTSTLIRQLSSTRGNQGGQLMV